MQGSTQKDLYLVRGLPGSGKSTFVESLLREGDVSVANDDFMTDSAGNYFFDWRRLGEVGDRCREAVQDAMEHGVERIFVHNTLIKPVDFNPYHEMAKEHGYRVFSFVIEKRHDGKSVHSTPEKTIEKYRRQIDISL